MAAICFYAATPLTIADEMLGLAAWLLQPPPDRSPRRPPAEAEDPPNMGLASWVRAALEAGREAVLWSQASRAALCLKLGAFLIWVCRIVFRQRAIGRRDERQRARSTRERRQPPQPAPAAGAAAIFAAAAVGVEAIDALATAMAAAAAAEAATAKAKAEAEAAAAEVAAAAAAARPTADGPQGAAPGAAPGGIEGAPASADAAPVATHPSSLHAGAAAGLEPAAAAAGAPRTAGSEAAAAAAAAAAASCGGTDLSTASCGGADLAPISDRISGAPISDEAESEPICRICYATLEEGLQAGLGRLVSPCLCVGSMRFVHTECLQQWRSMAANPRSFYTCDNCLFRYSFRRTSVAQVLRSVLVLHLITSLLLLLLLLLGALLIALVDRTFFDSTMAQLGWITDALWQDATPPSDAEAGAEAEVHSKLVAPGLAWLGGWLDSGHLAYLLWSGLSLGVLGFLSLGMVGPILFGGHGRRGGGQGQEGILLL